MIPSLSGQALIPIYPTFSPVKALGAAAFVAKTARAEMRHVKVLVQKWPVLSSPDQNFIRLAAARALRHSCQAYWSPPAACSSREAEAGAAQYRPAYRADHPARMRKG